MQPAASHHQNLFLPQGAPGKPGERGATGEKGSAVSHTSSFRLCLHYTGLLLRQHENRTR